MEGVVHRADNIGELDDLVRSLSADGFRIISVLDSNGCYVLVAQREVIVAFLNPTEIPFEIAKLEREQMERLCEAAGVRSDMLQKAIGRAEILPDYP